MLITSAQLSDFMQQTRLPEDMRATVVEHYVPLAAWIHSLAVAHSPFFLGVSGAQGTGKSTLAGFLKFALERATDLSVAVLSLDDFYLTRRERESLGKEVHPLFRTRGVPGTHDLQLLSTYLQQLRQLRAGEELSLPKFDKSCDDRADAGSWPRVVGPIDVVILEGWCVGTKAQSPDELSAPLNVLEREEDISGSWRQHVNRQLEGPYAKLFQVLNAHVYLQVPSFDAVFRWRYQQELELVSVVNGQNDQTMDMPALRRFIQHFERLSKSDLAKVPATADVTMTFDANHHCVRSVYANR